MIQDDFYATVKLKTGEELFAKVAATDEDDKTFLLVTNPVIVNEIKGKLGVVGYKVEPWLKTTTDDMFVINLDDILTLSESGDIEMIMMYQDYVRQSADTTPNHQKIDRKMGYIANVNDTKELLEKIFKSKYITYSFPINPNRVILQSI